MKRCVGYMSIKSTPVTHRSLTEQVVEALAYMQEMIGLPFTGDTSF